MAIKAAVKSVHRGMAYTTGGDQGDAVFTNCSFDDTEIQVVKHHDGDISIWVARGRDDGMEICIDKTQAEKFFSMALELCS